ncbi:MAG: YceI family protein [Chitinophagaceae bacterium]|nr:YceI family protein [Chitinophagaceae bacterium]MCB9047255.1 YceI family protein [Chitinophagales bacterium]
MKRIILAVIMVCGISSAYAQKYLTRTGKITFYAGTSLENIEAKNNEVASVLNAENGEFIFQAPVKSFKFERALMEEHFNENYMESSKYPKAEYKGKVSDLSKVNFTKDGIYNVTTKGKMSMHDVTKDVELPGSITVKGGNITVYSKFNIIPQDYNISIPGLVKDKIAKEVEVTVNSILEKK